MTLAENGPHTHDYTYYLGIQNMQPGGNSLGTQVATGTTTSSGSGTGHNTVARSMGCYVYLKL
jgi:hypothetical protein